MNTIYKICTAAEWQEAERAGVYRGSAVDTKDGFIHFSTAEQAAETAAKWFAGQHDLGGNTGHVPHLQLLALLIAAGIQIGADREAARRTVGKNVHDRATRAVGARQRRHDHGRTRNR